MKKLRTIALAVFAAFSISVMAQEGFGSFYAQYNISNMKYSHDSYSHSESFNAVSLGYNYAIPLSDPLYIELGVAGQYSWKSEDGASTSIVSAKVPLNIFYGFEISDGIFIDPFAGVYGRVHAWGQIKEDGESIDIFKDIEDGGMGAKRFQFGFQAGLRFRISNFMIGAAYSQDLSEITKHTKINSIDLTLGVTF